MSNNIAKILNNATRAMAAHQALIANTGNNIANVNTPGYARRVVNLQTEVGQSNSGTFNIGNGVSVQSLTRVVDEFLQTSVNRSGGDQAGYQTENDFLQRVQSLFSLTGNSNTVGSALTSFFNAANNLSVDPSSIELRSNFVEKGNDLVSSIKSTYSSLADLQTEADNRVVGEISTVNSITSQIAVLNGQISQRETSGGLASDERDRRDQLLEQLGSKISFSKLEQADGSVNISLSNGFTLVNGTTSRDLGTTTTPSFDATVPPSLGGGKLNFITYNYGTSAAPADLDLTKVLAAGSGSVAGLLRVRGTVGASDTSSFQADGSIVAMASRVEAVTRQLLTSVNQTYLGPDRDASTPATWEASSGDLNGNVPPAFGLFDFTYGGTKDSTGVSGLPEASDLTATGLDNFSSLLSLTSTDPRKIAAARDSSAGFPAPAVFASGDGSNIKAIADLQASNFTFSAGSFSLTTTFGSAYDEAVSYVGNKQANADVNQKVSSDALNTATQRRDQFSGVSLDEEFTDLIKEQKAFQASAKMIKTGSDLLDIIISAI
jgi:flagellar hook-associated protein 1 FlgK